MMITNNFSDLLDIRFRKIFYDRFDKVETTYEKVVRMLSSDRNYEKYSGISGVGEVQKLGDMETITETEMNQEFDKTFTHERFGNSAKVSKVLLDDDQFGEVAKASSSLSKSFKRNLDENNAQMFYRGFLATNKNGGAMVASDGVRHFSTIHYKGANETGTTYSNASSTGIALNETNLETGLIAMAQQLNPQGKLGYFKADTLLVPRALRKTANIILGSDKRSDTADNDMNIYRNEGIKLVVWDQLDYAVNASVSGSQAYWYLLDSSGDTGHQISLIMREQPNFTKNSPVFIDSNNYFVWYMQMRYSFGMMDWRGSWGSKGDGSAYSA